jgi:hypothetical protein
MLWTGGYAPKLCENTIQSSNALWYDSIHASNGDARITYRFFPFTVTTLVVMLYLYFSRYNPSQEIGGDGSRKERRVSSLTIKDCLKVVFQWEDFGQYLWASMGRLAKTGHITMMDLPKFVKTFCRTLTYRTSLRSFFENQDNIYKIYIQTIHCLKPSFG